MDATATELDFEAFEEISYDHLIESLNVEQKAQSRLAKELAQACDMRQELEYLLKSPDASAAEDLPVKVEGALRQQLQKQLFQVGAEKQRGSLFGRLKRSASAEETLTIVDHLLYEDLVFHHRHFTLLLNSLGRRSLWRTSLQLLPEMWQRDLVPNSISFNAAMDACQKGAAWQHATSLLKEMESEEMGIPSPDVVSYSTAMSACAKAGNWEMTLGFFVSMQQRLLSPDATSVSNVVTACSKGEHWELAIQLMEDHQCRRGEMDLVCHNAMIHAMCSGKRWQQAVDHFDQLPSADVVSYNTTMMALSESQEWQKALELFQQLKRHGPLPTTNSFNIAMDVWSQHDPSVDCAKQVDQLQSTFIAVSRLTGVVAVALWAMCHGTDAPILPHWTRWRVALASLTEQREAQDMLLLKRPEDEELDVIRYTTVITACQKAARWWAALGVLHSLRRSKLRANVVTYNSTLGSCTQAAEWPQALQLLDQVRANVVTYGSLCGSCGWRRARVLLGVAQQQRMTSLVAYSSCIGECQKLTKWQEALGLLEDVKKQEMSPDIILINATISACESASQWQEALLLLDFSLCSQDTTLVTYNCTISACGKAAQWRKVMQLLEELEMLQQLPDIITYNSTINAASRSQLWPLALALLAFLHKKTFEADTVSHTVAISACEGAQKWPDALQLLDQMKWQRFVANQMTCNATLSVCQKAARWSQTLLVLDDTTARRLTDVITYNVAIFASPWVQSLQLLNCLGHLGPFANLISYTSCISETMQRNISSPLFWRRSFDLLGALQAFRLRPTAFSFNAVVGVCVAEWPRAVALVGDMDQTQVEGDLITCNSLLSAFSTAALWPTAVRRLREAERSGTRPNIISCNCGIAACEVYGLWRRALLIRRELADEITYNALISACEKASAWPAAILLLREAGALADNIAFTSAAVASAKSMNWRVVMELLRELRARRLQPEILMYQALVQSLSAEMHRSSVPLAQDTYRIMIQAQAAGGHWPKVLALLQEAGRLEPVERDTSICGLGVLSKIPEAKDIMLQLASCPMAQSIHRFQDELWVTSVFGSRSSH
ncbi:Pentatricopeptide repeat-containing protein At2g41720 (Protein EMBRYO DEFECTIVE 2654) [Durusdinium trenchii]|uniref:Pentatricopeptide repeat-containing protein At2g41720 (Protein EMBRYO DEFECTIVE 2654) n=1 Tax=Durusdinium trenchii TaxID=1381693 RepID=A0ABP0I3Y3_9DINO